MKKTLLLALASLLIGLASGTCNIGRATTAPPSGPDAAAPVSMGRWTSRFLRGGLYLDYDGVPLVKGGLVQVFARDGRGLYSFGAAHPPALVEIRPDGGRAYEAAFDTLIEGARF